MRKQKSTSTTALVSESFSYYRNPTHIFDGCWHTDGSGIQEYWCFFPRSLVGGISMIFEEDVTNRNNKDKNSFICV